VEHPVSTI